MNQQLTALPPSFVCPLTRKLMEDPVMDTCAHTFERGAICRWVEAHDCCPISRKPMHLDDLISNHSLAERIERWQWEQENRILIHESISPSSSEDETDHHHDHRNDVEMGKWNLLRKKKSLFSSKPLPPQFMLLPQEQAMLNIARRQDEDRDWERRKHDNVRCTLVSVMVLVSVAAMIFAILKRVDLWSADEEVVLDD